MTTTKLRTYVCGNSTEYIADSIIYSEMQDNQDIEDGFASSGLSEIEELHNEVEVEPMFLADVGEDPDEYVPLDWMMDVLTNKYNLCTVNETALFNNILDLLAIHGFENASITVNGTTYN